MPTQHVHEKLAPQAVALVASRFRLLAEPTRLRIIQELHDGEKTVAELRAAVESTQPNVSKHLKILQDGGIVRRRQAGNSAYYAIDDVSVFELCDVVCRRLRQRAADQAAILQ